MLAKEQTTHNWILKTKLLCHLYYDHVYMVSIHTYNHKYCHLLQISKKAMIALFRSPEYHLSEEENEFSSNFNFILDLVERVLTSIVSLILTSVLVTDLAETKPVTNGDTCPYSSCSTHNLNIWDNCASLF